MSAYKTSKKIRYTISVVFVLFMTFIVGGSYLSQQELATTQNESSTK